MILVTLQGVSVCVSVCVHVCVYVYMYVYMCVYMYVYMYVCGLLETGVLVETALTQALYCYPRHVDTHDAQGEVLQHSSM